MLVLGSPRKLRNCGLLSFLLFANDIFVLGLFIVASSKLSSDRANAVAAFLPWFTVYYPLS